VGETLQAVGILLAAFLAGAIPFSNLAARRAKGVDLRRVGTGTVSGTSLYRVAGFGPLAAAGVLEVAKGTIGPGLATAAGRPALAALAAGAAVIGHNWSPFLRGAGGRGLSPALGALLMVAWPGAVLLLVGMIIGSWSGETAIGALIAELALAPVLAITHGRYGVLAGVVITVPMIAKRVVGNARPAEPGLRPYVIRLLYDRDTKEKIT
jgi:acyl phosphate:glycerol-3-phosphate acyltransferase